MRSDNIYDTLICLLKISFFLLSFRTIGFFKTFCLFYLYSKLYHFVLRKYFKLHRLDGPDRVLVGFNTNERYNMMAVLKMKNFEESKMKTFLIEKLIKAIPKFRSVLVGKYFTYFWQETSLEKAEEHVLKTKTITILNEEELMRIMKVEVNNHVDIFNSFPYEFIFVRYLNSPSEGAVIIKIDHCFTDGMGIVSLIGGIADNYSPDLYPSIMKKKRNCPNIFKIVKDIMMLPYIIFKHSRHIKVNSLFNPLNVKSSGESLIGFSKTYQFDQLFNACKNIKLSFNEFLLANISAGIKLYLKKNYKPEQIPQSIYISVPVGNTVIPSSKEDLCMKNSATVAFTQLPLIDDPICQYKQVAHSLKESVGNVIMPICGKLIIKFGLEFFPNYLFDYVTDKLTNKIDMCVSNVPGSKTKLFYSGSEIHDIFSVINTGMLFGFTLILSYDNRIKILFSFDKLLGIKPEDVIECVEKVIDNSIEKMK